MPVSRTFDHDVVIAGAGPVGLFLACELRLAGCSVLMIERAAGPASPLKALPLGLRGLTLPTMDSLDRRGLLAGLEARTVQSRSGLAAHWNGQVRQAGGHFAGLQFFSDRVDARAWPWRTRGSLKTLAVSMAELEGVLTERAIDLGVDMRRGRAVDALEQDADGVTIQAGGEAFRTPWLVGCDGGRSVVRKAAGIGFAGTEPELTGYTLLIELAEPEVLPPGRHHTATGMHTYAAPGTVAMVEYDGGTRHRADLSREDVEAVLRRVSGRDVRVTSVERATTWTDRAFLATTYRKDRVILAGDAAHIHAPLGGQGLNLGLGDAMNLGWKLAATIRGDAPAGLLDSYERERRPVAEQVLDWSRAQVALMRPDPGSAALRTVFRELIETGDGATYMAGRVWGADQRLGGTGHELVGRSAPDLRLADGTRLNEHMRDGRGVLVDLDPAKGFDPLAAPWRERLDYCPGQAAEEVGYKALLLRPDGIVAWVGMDAGDTGQAAEAISCWLAPTGEQSKSAQTSDTG